IGIWMQTADIQGQVAGVRDIPFMARSTRNTKAEENMLGLATDGVGVQTFPFLDELASMSQAGQGMHRGLLRWTRGLGWTGWCVCCSGSTASIAEGHPALHARSNPGQPAPLSARCQENPGSQV